jgi:hypothetical protein
MGSGRDGADSGNAFSGKIFATLTLPWEPQPLVSLVRVQGTLIWE